MLLDALEHLCLVVVCGQQLDAYVAFVALLVGDVLADVGIGFFKLCGLLVVDLAQCEVLQFGGLLEEHVVEVDDAAAGAVVRLERKGFNESSVELLLDVVE